MNTKNMALAMAMAFSVAGNAQNPIIKTNYSADPAPMVYDGTFYIYYDQDIGVNPTTGATYYYMDQWRVASSKDMVNWTDHGVALPLSAFSWTTAGTAWASQCIERNGKFYWYVCCEYPNRWHTVGVAVADTPTGPFKDALGRPLFSTGEMGDIDPTVFIDDDGQAYLYYGNNKLRYLKLNDDMISYDHSVGDNGIVTVELTKEAFGGVKVDGSVNGDNCFEEGPWLQKHNGLYYLIYAAGGVPENIAYSTSSSPEGPWTYRGKVMDVESTNSFTNHAGCVEFGGQHYFVYHTGWLNEGSGGGGFNRSVAIDYLDFNDDGTICAIKPTRQGVDPVAALNPFERVEAETMNNCRWGVTVEGDESSGVYVVLDETLDSVALRNVDFGSASPKSITVRVASDTDGGRLYVQIDRNKGSRAAMIEIPNTGGLDVYKDVTVDLTKDVTGVHRLIFQYLGQGETHWDCWRFNADDAVTVGVKGVNEDKREAGTASSAYYTLDGVAHDGPVAGVNIHGGKKLYYKKGQSVNE